MSDAAENLYDDEINEDESFESEHDYNQEENEELTVNEVLEKIKLAAEAITDGNSYQHNIAKLLKGLKNKIRKCPDVIADASDNILETVENVMTTTVDIEGGADRALLKEASEVLKTIIKKGNQQEAEYAVGSIFQSIEDCAASSAHQVAMMDALNFAMKKKPAIAEEFQPRIIFLTQSNIVKASNDCDDYYKDIAKQSVALLDKVVDYGINSDNEKMTQIAFSAMAGMVGKINPQMVEPKRRVIFNEIAKPIMDCIKYDPDYYQSDVRKNIFNSIANFEYNAKSDRKRQMVKNSVEKVTIAFDNTFTNAINKGLRKARMY